MHIDWLRAQTAAFAEAATRVDLDKQVVTCPEWSVRMLVAHIGHSHRQAANIVRTGEPEQFRDPRTAEVPPDWEPWVRDGAEELADAVTEAGTKQVWAYVGQRPASFWLRRMLHDTTVHAVDAARTAGVGYRIPADVAVDGIEEALDVISAPGVEALKPDFVHLRGTGQTLQLRASEGEAWLITRTPAGPSWKRGETGSPDVTLLAGAQDLLLLCYGRLGLDDVTVTGDRELITHWLAHTAL
ncbi:maleylpyruvate isomerase family mycothiol-dependent enzyme [Kibdelosporangium persicum]|uniref:Maleylpyruvate isomerase family mycothiol-dependent enzyme n=1 Tax=Kibdelosporangium persicum TaxID=2698649 RepID=A0ABX2F7U6_9PSEU|nr:maleylpyruvate isomerase family mycothiol-dependent enzyme [Kibdelosporangium persicum]NRN67342.1 Maleylpyruvate isomerase family mycothiol-dependent enzyme [Kibdelosporangium persicum]